MNPTNTLHSTDLDLVRATLRGDRSAVDRFVGRMGCVPRMLAVQNGRFGRPLDVEEVADLVQDVLVVIWKKLDQFQGRAALETWVYRVCRWELQNAIRRKRRQPVLVEEADTALPVRQEPGALAAFDRADSALVGLSRLGPPAADVIRLRHFEQLTFDEIGERLQISPNTAKTQYYRGLIKLRSIIDGLAEGGAA